MGGLGSQTAVDQVCLNRALRVDQRSPKHWCRTAPPWRTQIPVTGDGFAWVLQDGSLAVFDHVFAQPGADRACVSRIRSGERTYEMLAFPLDNPQSRSERVLDAVPISENTFVAVRSWNNSVALSWVTFK